MSLFKHETLALCISVMTTLGACGADDLGDAPLDEDHEHDDSASSRGASGGSADAGRSDGSGGSGTRDAGTAAPGDAGSAGALPSLDIGQDTPAEPAKRFEFVVTRAAETPACSAGSDDALGLGRVVIADSDRWVEVTVGAIGLSGAGTNAHVHFGDPGVAGPIVLDFGKLPQGNVFFKRFSEADFPKQRPASAPAGFPADFASFVASLRAGKTYLNLHTAACKTGEVRGQIVQ